MKEQMNLHIRNADVSNVNESDTYSKDKVETTLLDKCLDENAPRLGQDRATEDITPDAMELQDVTAGDNDKTTEEPTPVLAPFRRKLLITILIYWNMSTGGMIYAQMGPTLPDLQLITGSSLQGITWLFTGFGIGYIVGCLLAGIAQEKISPSLLLFICTLITGLTTGVLPWIENIYVSVGVKLIQGFTLAGQDTVDIAMIFATWREKSGTFNQLTHVVYAAGCFMSPLYSKPFLMDEKAAQVQHSTFNESANVSSNATLNEEYSADTNVHYAFLISALMSVSAAVPFLPLYIFNLEDPAESSPGVQEEKKTVALPVNIVYTVLGITFVTSFITDSCVEMFPNLLTTFVLRQLNWTHQNASNLTSVYYTLYGVGNVIGIFVLRYSTTNKLIVGSYLGSILSLIGCVIGSVYGHTVVVWITIVSLGASMASIIPTLFTWIEEHVTHVTGRIAAGILLFGAVGLMVEPILLGYLMEKLSPMWFLNITVGGIVLCAMFFVTSFSLVKRFS